MVSAAADKRSVCVLLKVISVTSRSSQATLSVTVT